MSLSMKKTWQSLHFRLMVTIAVTGFIVNVFGTVAWIGLSPYINYDEIASITTEALVVASIKMERSGPRIIPTPALRAYTDKRPGLRFAASLNGQIVKGSSPRLEPMLKILQSFMGKNSEIPLNVRNEYASMILVPFEHGRLVVITSGNKIGIDDIKSIFQVFASELLPIMSSALICVLIIVPFVLKAAMAPLEKVSRQALAIDLASLDTRLDERALPTEVMPLVQAMNKALDRLADAVARWRVFTANAAHELRTPVAIVEAQVDELPRSSDQLRLKRLGCSSIKC
jgi:two-component system, OmpR family, sensor kinase